MDDLIRGKKNLSPSKKARRQRFADERRQRKYDEAMERLDAHNALSLLDRIAKLDRRLGPNIGAVKERARLKAALEAQALVEENKTKDEIKENLKMKEGFVKFGDDKKVKPVKTVKNKKKS